jgi:hypothetical protein
MCTRTSCLYHKDLEACLTTREGPDLNFGRRGQVRFHADSLALSPLSAVIFVPLSTKFHMQIFPLLYFFSSAGQVSTVLTKAIPLFPRGQ